MAFRIALQYSLDQFSVAAGLDYVGVSPILSDLADKKRVRFESATDDEVMEALDLTMRLEGIIPALESSHALAGLAKIAPEMSRSIADKARKAGVWMLDAPVTGNPKVA